MLPTAEWGEEQDRHGYAKDGRGPNIPLPNQTLPPVELAAEVDRQRREGQEPEPFDEEPGALVEELVEEDPPRWKVMATQRAAKEMWSGSRLVLIIRATDP
jgi:hypothetical protein